MLAWTCTLTVASIVSGVASSFDDDDVRGDRDICTFYQSRLYVNAGLEYGDLTRHSINQDMEFLSLVRDSGEPVSNPDDSRGAEADRQSEDAELKHDIDNVIKENRNATKNTSVDVDRKVLKHEGETKRRVIHDIIVNDTVKGKSNASSMANHNSSGKEPFAKENVTVKKHRIIVKDMVNVTIKETVKVVEVASASSIVSIYFILFVPVLMAWATYYHSGMKDKHYMILIPVTLCFMSVGQDLVNQSLIMVMEAPYTVSCIHAYCTAVSLGLWLAFADPPDISKMPLCKLSYWLIVALLFTIYQLVNHVVYSTCSLSERTVFLNLCPLVSLLCENMTMPTSLRPSSSFGGKMALVLMLIGAILFSLQNPSFSLRGVAMASTLVLTNIPYRLAQRHFLGDSKGFSIALLVFLDGIVFAFPSTAIAAARNNYFSSLDSFLDELPVMIMLLLSILTFIGQHMCTLAMLRLGSATSYLVLQNIAGLMTIAMGIVFFGDRVLATPLACIGLSANVASGLWYSAVEPLSVVDSKDPPVTSDPEQKETSD